METKNILVFLAGAAVAYFVIREMDKQKATKTLYTKDGKVWTGATHTDEKGNLMTGATHTNSSEYLYPTPPPAPPVNQVDANVICEEALNTELMTMRFASEAEREKFIQDYMDNCLRGESYSGEYNPYPEYQLNTGCPEGQVGNEVGVFVGTELGTSLGTPLGIIEGKHVGTPLGRLLG